MGLQDLVTSISELNVQFLEIKLKSEASFFIQLSLCSSLEKCRFSVPGFLLNAKEAKTFIPLREFHTYFQLTVTLSNKDSNGLKFCLLKATLQNAVKSLSFFSEL